MNGNMLLYLLVAAAAASIGWVLWQSIVEAGEASSERLEYGNGIGADGKQKPQIERFISPGKLLRMRVMFAAVPALLVPGTFVAAGFMNPLFLTVFASAFAFAGWKLPLAYYRRLVAKRQMEFEDKILDLTMGCANALKSGMAFPQAVERIAIRMKGVMREELETVLNEYRLGLDLVESFGRLVERMPCEDMRLLTSAVKLTTKTGGSLAEVLDEMTGTIRSRREFQDKLKTLTAQGRFEGIGLGVMPVAAFLIFYFIQPELMSVMFKTTVGWCALGVAGFLELLGFLFVSKICDVEV